MKTLREIRTERGLRQSDIAEKIGRQTYEVSNYETGAMIPDLEDMIILERQLGERIDWLEPLQTYERRQIIQNLITLMERYPLLAVLSFGVRAIREDNKRGNPSEKLIAHYARASEDQEPLLPPNTNGNCRDCE